LVAWISLGVAEVEVEKDFKPGRRGAICQLYVVCEVIIAIGWIDPWALPDGIHTTVLENCLKRLGGAGSIFIPLSGGFLDES